VIGDLIAYSILTDAFDADGGQIETKVKTIKQTVVVSASPEEVYEAFMNAGKHSAFTGSKATCNPEVGGKFTAWDGYIFGKNLELDKGKRIVQEWKTTEWPRGYASSRLELTFRKAEGGTQIVMAHSDVPASQAKDVEQGWIDFYWTPLKEYFAR